MIGKAATQVQAEGVAPCHTRAGAGTRDALELREPARDRETTTPFRTAQRAHPGQPMEPTSPFDPETPMRSPANAPGARPSTPLSVLVFSPVLAAVLLTGAVPAVSAQDTSQLTVRGNGEVEVEPDRARIQFAVETEAGTAAEAGAANADLMDRVMSALRRSEAGGEARLETSGYQLQPRYGPMDRDRGREIVGYTARNTLQVISDDVEAVGPLVDLALDAGANRVAGLQFEIRDPEPHRLEALRRAVAQARAEAEVMAEALGMRLGLPTQVEGGAQRPSPRSMALQAFAPDMMAAATETPVEAGRQSVTASVTIRWVLYPSEG
ncbi:MAG: DUF541 domain-containing protein [Gemmatimonadales bacterium]|nr:MAG: DUF541 domain-containing protein [Gemmatimonadales bacterium]